MMRIVQKVVICDSTESNINNLQKLIAETQGRRAQLPELLMSKDIERSKFVNVRNKCEVEISKLKVRVWNIYFNDVGRPDTKMKLVLELF